MASEGHLSGGDLTEMENQLHLCINQSRVRESEVSHML